MRPLPRCPLALLAGGVRCGGCRVAVGHGSIAPNGGPIPPNGKAARSQGLRGGPEDEA